MQKTPRRSPRTPARGPARRAWGRPLRSYIILAAVLLLAYAWSHRQAGSAARRGRRAAAAARRLSLQRPAGGGVLAGAEVAGGAAAAGKSQDQAAVQVAAADFLAATTAAGSAATAEGAAAAAGTHTGAAAATAAELGELRSAAPAAAGGAGDRQGGQGPGGGAAAAAAASGEEGPGAAAGEEDEEDAEGAAAAAAATQPAAVRARAAAAAQQAQQAQQTQHAGDAYTPSAREAALRGCATLTCLRDAHQQRKHAGQFNFPHFFILGFPKCATTSLYHHLIQHPQIMAPLGKEPHFFTRHCNSTAGSCSKAEQLQYINQTLHLGIALDARLFMATFEASTHYSLEGEWLASQLADLMPWLKLVLSMREPISRAISMLQHNLDHDRRPRCYNAGRQRIFKCIREKLLENEMRYASRLAAWLEHFPRDQLHVLQYENLTSAEHMRGALRDLKRFIGIGAKLPSDELGVRNARRANYSEGWPMTRREYSRLVDLARGDAEDVLDVLKRHRFGEAEGWMRAWEKAWRENLERCAPGHNGLCLVPAT